MQNEAALANFTLKLRNFRPAATVLEAEIAKVKSTFTNPLLDADALQSKSNDVSSGTSEFRITGAVSFYWICSHHGPFHT